ncbi:phage major capsid protein [Bradyrhizobium sp. SBR1B]|uniref:phage major capsid protein n=1 Tax=Bradyrhizobium sp. SBR1B TaxID=2663836 RepID=UPI00160651ED|nr:phage major capsid protein [Bradyrhizobium sp. SBR1B]MBB4375617.1 HK97 family phage major capsid protein [Bradyrhizobium sp. SBR1B]
MSSTILKKSTFIKGAAAHLHDSAIKTKNEGSGDDPLQLIAKKFGEHTAQVMEKLGATNDDMRVLREQLATLEQKALETHYSGRPAVPDSVGKQFVESERVKSFLESNPSSGRVDLRLKATLTTATTNAAGSVGAMGTPFRDGVVTTPRRRPTVRSLLPVINISSGTVEWPSQNGRTEGAGMVAEGATKPSSDVQFELKTTAARVIAHWMKASKQVLEDVPQLRGIIDTELLDGLALQEEVQLLLGDGTGQNLLGLIPQATAYSAPIVGMADLNSIDVIALGALQVANAYFEPDGAIINPGDWWGMRLLKDSTGNYIVGSPSTDMPPVLWGLPLVATPAMTSRKFLIGQFRAAATLYDRWDARVEVGYVNDDFIKNLVTVLAEERVALAVKASLALTYGDFDVALAV